MDNAWSDLICLIILLIIFFTYFFLGTISVTNYVDKILAFFDILLPSIDIFYGINVDKKLKFLESLTSSSFKVHIFWEGHKILRNLQLTFDWYYIGQK